MLLPRWCTPNPPWWIAVSSFVRVASSDVRVSPTAQLNGATGPLPQVPLRARTGWVLSPLRSLNLM